MKATGLPPGIDPLGRQVLARLRNTAKAEPAEIIALAGRWISSGAIDRAAIWDRGRAGGGDL